ncbi:nucleotidyltransferase family protein [Flavobacterium polysaccharolyticum]|uniref:NTP transferase domain-containing protein n=1 Tax=Flavobacterium polysaccharolyticum TaxID=3133148 RepID=A0ABU9NQW4_9FLAO
MKNNVAFVVLAGGKSERMGQPKGLLFNKEEYWLETQLKSIASAGGTEVYIALGFHTAAYCETLPWLTSALQVPITYLNLNIRAVQNPNPERGSFSSLQTVLSQIEKPKTILLCPIDVPIPKDETLELLLEKQQAIAIPNYKGKNGHPIVMNPSFWKSLVQLNPSNSRLDYLIKACPLSMIGIVPVENSEVILNLNTPEDWISYQTKIDK